MHVTASSPRPISGIVATLACVALLVCASARTAAAQPTPTPPPAGRALEVQRVSGRCGENALGAQAAAGTVTARVTRRGLDVRVRNYVFNCGQILQFTARREGGAIVLTPRPLDTSAPVASCSCLHEARLLVKGIEPGNYEVRVDTGEDHPVLIAPGRGFRNERVYLRTNVAVPGAAHAAAPAPLPPRH